MFCGVKKMINCMLNNPNNGIDNITESVFADDYERRRFGVNSDGIIAYDDFGEPINLNNQQNYLSNIFTGKVEIHFEENKEDSKIGGINSLKEYIQIVISYEEDVQENDIIIFPISTNNSYRVIKDIKQVSNKRRYIYAISELKATK